MDLLTFYRSTVFAFNNIEKKFSVSHVVKNESVIFFTNGLYLIIYIENYFEVNIDFSFREKVEKVNIPLRYLLLYLNFNEEYIKQATQNQFTTAQVYRKWIFDIAEICEVVIDKILQDNTLLSSCYLWLQDKANISRKHVEIEFIKRKLNDLWNNKEYSAYLSYFLDCYPQIKEIPEIALLEKRAKYIQKTQGDGSKPLKKSDKT